MRTSRIFWSLLLLFLSLTAAARAQGDRDSLAAATTDPLTVQTAGGNSLAAVEQVWDAANTAYINSDYHRAIDAYRQLILRGYASDKLYYNLANAYFKVGRYGKAILYYNRALRLAPGDADIRYNLDVANTFTKDKIAVVPEFFLKGWVRSVRMSLGCTAWSVVSLAALALPWWRVQPVRAAQRTSKEKQRAKGFRIGVPPKSWSKFVLAIHDTKKTGEMRWFPEINLQGGSEWPAIHGIMAAEIEGGHTVCSIYLMSWIPSFPSSLGWSFAWSLGCFSTPSSPASRKSAPMMPLPC